MQPGQETVGIHFEGVSNQLAAAECSEGLQYMVLPCPRCRMQNSRQVSESCVSFEQSLISSAGCGGALYCGRIWAGVRPARLLHSGCAAEFR